MEHPQFGREATKFIRDHGEGHLDVKVLFNPFDPLDVAKDLVNRETDEFAFSAAKSSARVENSTNSVVQTGVKSPQFDYFIKRLLLQKFLFTYIFYKSLDLLCPFRIIDSVTYRSYDIRVISSDIYHIIFDFILNLF